MLLCTSTFDTELPDLSEGVLLCDALQPDWRVLLASTRSLQLLGLTRSQGIGRKLWDMLEVPGACISHIDAARILFTCLPCLQLFPWHSSRCE